MNLAKFVSTPWQEDLLLPYQPNFSHVTPAAIVAQTRLAIPVQPQFPALRRFRWDVKLQGLWRNAFCHKGMNFDAAVRNQANPAARQVARINDAEFIAGRGIEAGVTQVEWLVIKRRSAAPPGNSSAFVAEIHERRMQKRRVSFKARSLDQMRLTEQIAEVVVETARAWIGPTENFSNAFEALLFGGQIANPIELLSEPEAVVQWHVDVVEVRAAVHRDCPVKRDA